MNPILEIWEFLNQDSPIGNSSSSGVERVTEDGQIRLTEGGEIRIIE